MTQLPTFYRGAGTLFSSRNSTGTIRFLLGKRLRLPFRGYWTVPGGEMDEDDGGDFRITAAREVFEETVGIAKLDSLQQRLLQRLDRSIEHRVHVPFCFDFRVFHVELSIQPDLRLWPNQFHWGNEFERFGWFELDHLPEPRHPGIRRIINRASQSSRPRLKFRV